MRAMSVRVRMAPSPTGFLHIGNVRTFVFNWLFARHEGGECRLRIENTDTAREVLEATDYIKESLRWLGLDWDGDVTFQLDSIEHCQQVARQLVEEGKAYEDEGAIRFRMPDEGMTGWDDVILGRVDVPNKELDDMVILRSDGRPLYNFASPLEDVQDGITHVIRGPDHVSNTPKQINLLQALGATLPIYGHVPNVLGPDGKKLGKRHGSVGVGEFREQGYLPEALLNFLALLGWSYDDKTTIMSREELVARFTLERVGASPAVFDYQKLDWLNGMYIRSLPVDEFADRLVAYLRERGYDWDEDLVRKTAPLVQEKNEKLGDYPAYAGFFFHELDRDGDGHVGDPAIVRAAHEALEHVEPFEAAPIEQALRGVAERLELKPREAFQPIRIAVTGSKVSPGLFESLEVLGKAKSLARLSAVADAEA
jgi:glutamyl-tRNA synthetase